MLFIWNLDIHFTILFMFSAGMHGIWLLKFASLSCHRWLRILMPSSRSVIEFNEIFEILLPLLVPFVDCLFAMLACFVSAKSLFQ